MRAKVWGRLDERGVRLLLAAFFVALAVPGAVLVAQAYDQLKWQAFRQNQSLAEDVAARIDADLRVKIAAEEARSFGDYSFLVVAGGSAASFVQRSPLAAFPPVAAVPGVLGFFQIDANGALTTPLLPDASVDVARYGIAPAEEADRAALVATIRAVLAANRLVRGARDDSNGARRAQPERADDAAAARASVEQSKAASGGASAAAAEDHDAPQAAFDRLASKQLQSASPTVAAAAAPADSAGAQPAPPAAANFARDTRPAEASVARRVGDASLRQKRTEQGLLLESPQPQERKSADDAATDKRELAVRTFESEVDPFELGALDTGHWVLFRNAWRDGRRFVQGALLDRDRFLAQSIEAEFRASNAAAFSDLTVVYRGAPLRTFDVAGGGYAASSAALVGAPLYRARLSPPFGELELAFGVQRLPRAPGTVLLAWVSVTFAVVLCAGFLLMYRFAVGQLRLARQQQDFVSAVSHELKTPLTSIRMYGEMLRAGWADDAKKQTYYGYIESESERLSRLIENVLQLARLTRGTQRVQRTRTAVAELLDVVRSKVATQIERAGFTLEIVDETPAGVAVTVDGDAFTQIVINLVDNALKFAAGAERKCVRVSCRLEGGDRLLFAVRDYGPGIPKGQLKRIFELFYRPADELTRATVGTGIGLALVSQLSLAMSARVDVRNCEPGAEFRVSFRAA